MNAFIRQFRYTVLKDRDVHLALNKEERAELEALCLKVDKYRAGVGRPTLICVVVEADWPEYEPTWDAIEKRVETEKSLGAGQVGEGS